RVASSRIEVGGEVDKSAVVGADDVVATMRRGKWGRALPVLAAAPEVEVGIDGHDVMVLAPPTPMCIVVVAEVLIWISPRVPHEAAPNVGKGIGVAIVVECVLGYERLKRTDI